MERHERFDSADIVIRVGFWANVWLMAMKLLAGHFGRSEAVFADGLESAADFIAILSSMLALRISRRPFDREHPYGHGRAENIAAVIVSFVIFGTGAWILVRAVHSILEGPSELPSAVAVAAAFITILVKNTLYRYSRRVGMELESPAILATAKDHRKDAVSSVATLIGVAGAFLGVGVMDPIAAGVTAFFIFLIAYGNFMTAAHDLMDGCVPEDFEGEVKKIAEAVQGVEHVHEIRCRRSGQYVIIDLKLDMDPEMTVRKSHAIAANVKLHIFERFPNVGDVMIHVNPHEEEHEDMIRL